jgi:hypothetical protein
MRDNAVQLARSASLTLSEDSELHRVGLANHSQYRDINSSTFFPEIANAALFLASGKLFVHYPFTSSIPFFSR